MSEDKISSGGRFVARAPGKLVLSGAYAVLDGAPAIVAAVDRYVIADAARRADFVTPEVRAALGETDSAPWFDARGLREGERKLGLGSSAAILVASLGARALALDTALSEEELRREVFPVALRAHRQAQGGGSGVDVAASVHGGVLAVEPNGDDLDCKPVSLPEGVLIRVLAAQTSASTPALISSVRRLRSEEPSRYERLMGAQTEASKRAVSALASASAKDFVAALSAQSAALSALGDAAHVNIVTKPMQRLAQLAASAGAVLLPAGAGGGDIALWIALEPDQEPPADDELRPLTLALGAAGLGRATS
jgi:phosphomevalonate kinase